MRKPDGHCDHGECTETAVIEVEFLHCEGRYCLAHCIIAIRAFFVRSISILTPFGNANA